MPAATPRSVELNVTAAAKLQAAPIAIMPSTPRFSTPERSVTSSPKAAISSGVDAVTMVSRMASKVVICPLPVSRNECGS